MRFMKVDEVDEVDEWLGSDLVADSILSQALLFTFPNPLFRHLAIPFLLVKT